VKEVAIVGVGLIGGSFALALRAAGFTGKITGVSSADAVREALDHGVIDEALSLVDAAARADLIYLSRPISGILTTIEQLDAIVSHDALITDAGSTKSTICTLASEKIFRARFVGGHPMAGKESRGAAEADAELFRGRPYVLTSACPELEDWIHRIGAKLVIMPPEEHDRLVAFTSHLPQLISTALASSMEAEAAKVAGPAASDLTRLALSPYDIWRDIFETNQPSIDAALGAFIAKLEELRRNLTGPEVEREFERAAESAKRLRRS
jgi:prephenate dehydrogenase